MDWLELLRSEVEETFRVTEGLIGMVTDDELAWKPPSGQNWMTVAQLLRHISDACGMAMRGFVTGDWGIPEGQDTSQMSPEQMLPPAEKLPAVQNVSEAKKLFAADKDLTMEMLSKLTNEQLATQPAPAPWDPSPMMLGRRLLHMVYHLASHKSQLFYYLKLMGKPVNTGSLWGE